MDLATYPTDALLQELNTRGVAGVASLQVPGKGWVGVWWGDRVKCLGLAGRMTCLINTEIDEEENPLVDEGEDEPSELEVEYPQMGQYL